MSTIKAYWRELVMLLLAIAVVSVTACQSMPAGLRIGVKSAARAAAQCIGKDQATAPRDVRIKQCVGVILVEAGEAVEEIEALPVSPPSKAIVPSAPPAPSQPPAPSSGPVVIPPEASAPESGAMLYRQPDQMHRPDRDGPPCKGWRYRYKRG